jgi:hypothetical protein
MHASASVFNPQDRPQLLGFLLQGSVATILQRAERLTQQNAG